MATTNKYLFVGSDPVMDQHPIWGGAGVEIFLVVSCYRNRDKLQPYGLAHTCMQTLPLLSATLKEIERAEREGSLCLKGYTE